jgi:hypothetical protein
VQPEEAGLYGLPLDEFIPARTALEKRLRKEGERERAAAVKKLPKPSVAAWAVNQASRSQPQARRDLLDASAELREVQDRLIAGDATASDLEAATTRQRAAIDALVDAAAGLLTGDGKSLGDATLARVRETFAAVASDTELADLVEAGTVDRERRPSGLGFPFAAPSPAETAPKGGSGAGKAPKGGSGAARAPAGRAQEPAKERKQREKDAKRRERELQAAREAVKSAKTEEKEAARRRKAAEREAARAARELDRAERAAEEARAAAEAAQTELDSATAAAEAAVGAREDAEAQLESFG